MQAYAGMHVFVFVLFQMKIKQFDEKKQINRDRIFVLSRSVLGRQSKSRGKKIRHIQTIKECKSRGVFKGLDV